MTDRDARLPKRLTWLILGLSFFVIGSAGLAFKKALAADFNYKTAVDYSVDDNGVTTITENFQITNLSSRQYLDSLELSTPTDEVNNLQVNYADGTPIGYKLSKKSTTLSGVNYDYQVISVAFPRQLVGSGTSWSFTATYQTSKLVDTKGPAKMVFIPAISASDLGDDYTINLAVPEDFGTLHSDSAIPISGGLTGGKATYSFNKQDLAKHSLALTFGDSTIYHINFNYPLKNDSAKSQTFTVTLPPDTSSQKVFINSLDPRPNAIRLDEDGNVLADYTLSAHTNITVKTDISAVVHYIDYDTSVSGTKADIPAELVKKYTNPAYYWQSTNPDIVAKAGSIDTGTGKVIDTVKALNQFVIDTLSYNPEKIKYNVRVGALGALKNPNNVVCLEYSDLLIALLRSRGIPARMPIGYGYSASLKPSRAVSDSLHSWVEAYVPGIGWMNVDPTWGEKFANFGHSDLDHFAFALWGINDATPVAVSSSGRDQNYQYEDAQLDFKTASPTAATVGSLVVHKYIILPFFSLINFKVTAPANISGDNYTLNLQNGQHSNRYQLGSLAAGQKLSGWLPQVSLAFGSRLQATLAQQQGSSLNLASATTQANFWPMIIILALLTGIIIWRLLKLLVASRKKRSSAASAASAAQSSQVSSQPIQPPPDSATSTINQAAQPKVERTRDEPKE